MPTLEEVRRWLQGESVEGLPSRKKRRQSVPVTPPDVANARPSKQYKISADGTDALVLFGKQFPGAKLSDIVKTPRGRKYMSWILDKDFDEAFKAVCRYQMDLHKSAKS